MFVPDILLQTSLMFVRKAKTTLVNLSGTPTLYAVFVTGKPFQPSLMFASKARSSPVENLKGALLR